MTGYSPIVPNQTPGLGPVFAFAAVGMEKPNAMAANSSLARQRGKRAFFGVAARGGQMGNGIPAGAGMKYRILPGHTLVSVAGLALNSTTMRPASVGRLLLFANIASVV
jgi:hypothetical protein